MLRKTILIGDTDASAATNGPLPGARKDVQDIYGFLTTPCGGAWSQAEIDWYQAPNHDEINPALEAAKDAYDYLFVAIVGHGARDPRWGSVVSLNDNSVIRISEIARLGRRARRVLVLSGACRLQAPPPPKSVGGDDDSRMAGIEGGPNRAYIQGCRAAFAQAVMRAEEGVAVMYSCSANEQAWYTARGGFFTQALLERASHWAGARSNGYEPQVFLPVAAVFAEARALTSARVCDAVRHIQTPEMAPAPSPNFPFAIA